MVESLPLRSYQQEALNALFQGWSAGPRRLAVVLPTGAGKTVVFSHLAARAARAGRRTLIIAHRDELIRQAADKVRAVSPDLKVGIVKADENDHADADVIVGSQQTLAKERRRNEITGLGLVVVDEAHHAAADTYKEILRHFGCFDGRMYTAGFTATMSREDGGLADVWEDIVYRRDILEMIRDRHLVDVRGKTITIDGLNLDTVKSRAGDFQDGQLGTALNDSGAAVIVADAYQEHAADRPGILFAPTVDAAHIMTSAMNSAGIPTATVWGAMGREERAAALEGYRTGKYQCLSNCMVLTEGFDAPWASCAVIARPTQSAALYVQMVGRVLRPWKDKRDALVLDVAGISTKHKLASIVDLTSEQVAAPEDNESLLEAEKRERTGITIPSGNIDWEEVNLFADSSAAWLATRGGTWFLSVPQGYFFLLPDEEPGNFRVRYWKQGVGPQVADPEHDMAYPLEYAMRWAEMYADRVAGSITRRAMAWRSRPMSPSQSRMCRSLQIPVVDGMTQGQASQAISVVLATRDLDGFLGQGVAA